jgi:carbonic anhydrase
MGTQLLLNTILLHNKGFVSNEDYKPHISQNIPRKKLAIVSCMDARLITLLPAALGLKNGDAKIIKNAGAVISDPNSDVIRSLLITIYELGVETIFVIGHKKCGVENLDTKATINKMLSRNIPKETLDSYDIDINEWLGSFTDVNSSVLQSVKIIETHPLIPKEINVHGLVMDPHTGELELIK